MTENEELIADLKYRALAAQPGEIISVTFKRAAAALETLTAENERLRGAITERGDEIYLLRLRVGVTPMPPIMQTVKRATEEGGAPSSRVFEPSKEPDHEGL